MNPPPIPNPSPKIPGHFAFEPMPDGGSPNQFEALLKYPGRIIHELQHKLAPALARGCWSSRSSACPSTGGCRKFLRWIANVDRARETRARNTPLNPDLSAEPLHFRLSQRNRCPFAHSQRRPLRRDLFGALLLIGFAPVAWIFSQSTDSIAFMGALHLILWAIGISFGLRLIDTMSQFSWRAGQRPFQIWAHFYRRLSANDDDVATDHRAGESIFCPVKEIFPCPLV